MFITYAFLFLQCLTAFPANIIPLSAALQSLFVHETQIEFKPISKMIESTSKFKGRRSQSTPKPAFKMSFSFLHLKNTILDDNYDVNETGIDLTEQRTNTYPQSD
jgi:hypothetical protein